MHKAAMHLVRMLPAWFQSQLPWVCLVLAAERCHGPGEAGHASTCASPDWAPGVPARGWAQKAWGLAQV